ncbi:MAG: hypothetical protein SCM11_06155 [Bacillota bacterium]|nr:hypothetical protein [Bacillota bacterium]
MKNLFRLAYVLFRGGGMGSLGSDSSQRKKRGRAGSLLLFAFVAIYMVAIMAGSSIALYDLLAPAGLQELLIGLYISIGTILVFLFGILYVISIFYYSGDVERLLPLPLPAGDIIGAKLLVTAAWEYLYLFVLILPPLIVYGVRSGSGPAYYLFMVWTVILIPVMPLCLASVIVMLILRFTPLARNKDRFNLISGLLAMGLALAFVFGTQSMTSFSEADLTRIISSGTDSVARLTTTIFPGANFAVGSLTSVSLLQQSAQAGLLLLISAAALFVTLRLAGVLYFPGVIGIQASAAKRRRLNVAQLQTAGKGGSAFWTYWRKDLRILLRTPIFFMNNILVSFLWPIFILIPFLSGAAEQGLAELIPAVRLALFAQDGRGAAIAVAGYFGVACFISGTNGIASSALSREGKVFYIMKIIPMAWKKQILAKISVGALIGVIGTLLPLIIFIILLQPPVWLILALLAVLPGGVILPNLSGIIFELYWPKLNWDNEQKAVKQNLNVLYGMAISLVFAALFAVPAIVWQLPLTLTVLLIGAGSLVLSLAVLTLLLRILPHRMLAIEP